MARQWSDREWYEYENKKSAAVWSSSSSSRAVSNWTTRTAGRIDSEHDRNPSANIGGLNSDRAQTETDPNNRTYNSGGRVSGQTCIPYLYILKHVRYISGAPVLVDAAPPAIHIFIKQYI